MDIVVIGGTGHIGTFLVPRLVRSGHRVTVLSRGEAAPYQDDPTWDEVRRVTVDRAAEDETGAFPRRVARLGPDAVIDLVCFTLSSAVQLVGGLRGNTGHLLHCGSIWMHGKSLRVPIGEDDTTEPFGEYGTQKAAIAAMLRAETLDGGLVTTSIHPGHISGPGWAPVGPLGNLDPQVWQVLAAGGELQMPGFGAELLSHVHADDVAQLFHLATEHRDAARAQMFHATAATALTVRGFAELAARWFGRSANLTSVSWDTFRRNTSPEYAQQSWEHLVRSQHVSIDKAKELLGYRPAHAPEDAARAGVESLVAAGRLELSRPLLAGVTDAKPT
jgi:nucleoside-diphosphate-sugar epimerase